jgi:DNA repair protein RecO (recombination protein O)
VRVAAEPAFVLHCRDYSESSLLLEVFAARHGRLGILAKGARRPKSPWRGVLKPFQALLLSWSGRGELAILTGAEAERGTDTLGGPAVFCGFYLNELLMRLLHRHDPHEALYRAYRQALLSLGRGDDHEAVLRIFEKHLLRELGYGLVLDYDIESQAPLDAEAVYDYLPERGPRRMSGANRSNEGVLIRGASLLALAREQLNDEDTLREVKALMRASLARHLGDKPLNSRRLYQSVVAARVRNNTRSTIT